MPKVKTQPEPPPEYVLTMKLVSEFRQFWVDQMKESGVSAVLYSRLSVVALTQVASVVAIDVGMTPEQFASVCHANFVEAYKKAPKFG